MAKGFKHGIAGTALNFRVLGGTVRPASPRENDIWIVTDTPIQGWVLSQEQPEPEEGLVWIGVGTGDTGFNALKKNGILLTPVSAQLYSGGWENVEAFLYAGGWVQFGSLLPEYFYKDGDATVELLFNTTKYTNSDGYITITPSTSNPDIIEPEAYFVIPDIEKYGAISCVLQYAYYTPIVYIRKISTGENVAQASPTSSGDTVSIDLSGLGLSGNDYYFVLYTKAQWHMTNGATGAGYWEDVYAKTNHIWGDAK